jgi:hypothetical protein
VPKEELDHVDVERLNGHMEWSEPVLVANVEVDR